MYPNGVRFMEIISNGTIATNPSALDAEPKVFTFTGETQCRTVRPRQQFENRPSL